MRKTAVVFWATILFGPAPVVFTDFRGEKPGQVHKITLADLPAPYATSSIDNGPHLASRPSNAMPEAPAGFKVTEFARGLKEPRLIRRAPNGDLFVAESEAGNIRVLRGIKPDGSAQMVETYATGLESRSASHSTLPVRTRNTFTWAIPGRWCASPTRTAI